MVHLSSTNNVLLEKLLQKSFMQSPCPLLLSLSLSLYDEQDYMMGGGGGGKGDPWKFFGIQQY